MTSVTPFVYKWTHDALEGLYDLAFLERHVHDPGAVGRFTNGRAAQELIQHSIKQLRPPLTLPERSPALRLYHVLNLRYVQGLSQAEAASELNLSVRHFKREQERAIGAVAALLFEQPISTSGLKTVETAAPAPEMEYVRIDELLRLALNVLDLLLARQGLHITAALPPALPLVRANRIVTRQMLISALSWLVHGMHNTELTITAADEPPYATLRLTKPTSDPGDTSGAAEELNMAQQLAASLGVRAELQTMPAETTLQLALPVSVTRCILLIEDNPDSIELVKRYLEQSGEYHLVAVTHALEAQKQAALLQPACILLDIMMPERDGWDVLTLLKADPLTAAIPVVVSSVVKGHDLAHALGAVDILPKPFTAAQLIAVLRAAEKPAHQSPARQSAE
jgi:CheY-like chemotaxis protein